MATLIKPKKAAQKFISKTKIHSLIKGFGAIKEKGFSIETKAEKSYR